MQIPYMNVTVTSVSYLVSEHINILHDGYDGYRQQLDSYAELIMPAGSDKGVSPEYLEDLQDEINLMRK